MYVTFIICDDIFNVLHVYLCLCGVYGLNDNMASHITDDILNVLVLRCLNMMAYLI